MLFTSEMLSFIVVFFWIFSVGLSKRKAFLKFHKVFHNLNINWNFKRCSDAKSWEKLSFFESITFCFVVCSTSLFQLKTIRKFKLKLQKGPINLTLFLLRFKTQLASEIPLVLALDKLEFKVKLVQCLYLYSGKFFIDIFPILYNNDFTFYESYEMLQIVFYRVKTGWNTLISGRLWLLLDRWPIGSS